MVSLGSVAVKNAHFGEGSGDILLDDVMCRGTEAALLKGTEAALLNCSRKNNLPIASSNCKHSEDAGVICQGGDIAVMYIPSFPFSFTIIVLWIDG